MRAVKSFSSLSNIVNRKLEKKDTDERIPILNKKKDKKIFLFLKKNKKNFKKVLTLLFQILLHITLLSMLEPIFFFEYANKIETKVFTQQLVKYFRDDNLIKEFKIENPILKKYVIEELKDRKDHFIRKYQEVDKLGREGFLDRMNNNLLLERNAYKMFSILFGSTFILFFLTYLFEQLKYKIIFLEHILLMIFIGLYEYWFFRNILLKFTPLSTEEMNKMFMTCFFKLLSNKYEELEYLNDGKIVQCFIPQ